jgi:hypothetical protein
MRLLPLILVACGACSYESGIVEPGTPPGDGDTDSGAVLGPALRVDATWTDTADLNLHLIGVGGSLWGDDCHPQAACDLDWGNAADDADDPALSGDSIATGPERIDVPVSEDGAYRVALVWNALISPNSDCAATTDGTVRVYVGGELAWEGDHPFAWAGEAHPVWYAAEVVVDGENATVEADDSTDWTSGVTYPARGC